MSDASGKRDYSQLMKEALLELKQLRARYDDLKRTQTEPIAIIGMSCRLPGGVTNPEDFWRLLHDGVDAISPVPADRWDAAAYYDANPDAPGKMATRFGGFIDHIDQFDAGFFGISPIEARSLDPQQRLLLEVTWEALERAGQSPQQLYGTATAVFVGMSTFDYALHQVGGLVEQEDLQRLDGYVATGTTMSPAAGRLSYVLGLNGPSMVVDTACSSSLVATHLAIASLRNRECDLAIVGGVNLILRPEWNVNFTKARMLAPDGRCKTFDAAADGYTRGEGCGVIVLQRMSDAIAARRNIIASIRSSAVNQDGASGGLTVPSGPSQEQVVRRALDAAGVPPGQVSYVEAHGTGTSLGDPIEVGALGAVFGPEHSKQAPLRIGSVKTNIGHLEAAAGVAGLIKVALALRHREIPPHLHFRAGNPMVDWDRLPIEVPVRPTSWPQGEGPRRAGISSFGFTGTNAHLILEEAPAVSAVAHDDEGGAAERPVHVLTASARTVPALQALSDRYARHFTEHPGVSLPDAAFTANTGRAQFKHRLAIVGRSLDDVRAKLTAHAAGESVPGVFAGDSAERPKIAFLFTGQGSQYAGMGQGLYATQPVFRAAIDRCDELLRGRLDRPLLQVLFPAPGETTPLDETAYTQPALFALEHALATLWRSWGIEPDVVMGHSVGEYVAACIAGIFSLEDGLALIAERARLMQALSREGQMVAVQTREERAAAAIAAHRDVSLAAINGPTSIVISGAAGSVSAVSAVLTAEGAAAQSLRVSHAFHSPLMEPMLDAFEQAARRVTFGAPVKPIVSNVSGRLARAEMATPAYWVQHVRQPVRFADGMATLHEQGCSAFVEVGPASTLLALGRSCLPASRAAWLPSLRAGHDWDQIADSLAALYAHGAAVDWAAFDRPYARRPVDLPTYPFQRQRYWIDRTRPERSARPARAPHQAAVRDVSGLLYTVALREQGRRFDTMPGTAHGTWMIVGDGSELSAAVCHLLEERGGKCTVASVEDVGAAARPSLRGIIDLRPVAARAAECSDLLEGSLQVLRRASSDSERAVPVWCVTRGAIAVDHGDRHDAVSLAQAPLWGFGRVAALESPQSWGGLIDVGVRDEPRVQADAIVRELIAPDGEDQIVLRGTRRYVPRLVPRPAHGAAAPALDPAATYLVAGGTGALGHHAARWLVARGARTIALVSRRGRQAPAVDEQVRELRAGGADEVMVLCADVSRADHVDRVLAQITDSGKPLRGIVHAAGIDARVAVADMTPGDLRAMLASKVQGAWLLHEKTRGLPLDLFVCFSSVSSIWGAPQRAHYAAANAFLDALAHERRRLGLAALSVNWGPWRGGGMAGESELAELEASGLRALDPADAVSALAVLIAAGDVQATVADVDWAPFRARFEARRPRPLLREVTAPASEGAAASEDRADWMEQLRPLSPEQRVSTLEQLVRGEVADVLGFRGAEEVAVDQSVFELGMDSLRAVQLTLRLQQHLGIATPIQFFERPQIRALVPYLIEMVFAAESAASQGVAGYTPECEDEIYAFGRAAWPNRPQAMLLPRWRWMFVESAARFGLSPRVWLYREHGKLVAHHAATPVRLDVAGESFDSGWFADTMVLEPHRATATGAHLLVASNDEFPIGLSLGQTEPMRKIALSLGWQQVAPLQTMVLLLRPYGVLRLKLNPFVARAASVGMSARRRLKRRLAGAAARVQMRKIDRFDATHDRLWETVKGDYRCAVTRDASYLNWKYLAQPQQEFERFEFVRNGIVAAVAVLAFDEPGPVYGYRRAFIVDLVVPASDEALVLAVLDGIAARCRAAAVDAIVFHVINARLERLAAACGYMLREPARYLLVLPRRTSDRVRQQLLSPDNWLITMGDSDIDRPWEVAHGRVQIRGERR